MKVLTTTNYDKFSLIYANRQVNEAHVKNLCKSFRKRNLFAVNPIIVNNAMEVIDGQHRLEVARKLKLTVHYIVIAEASIDDIAAMQVSARWLTADWAESWYKRGVDDYGVLLQFAKDHDISVSLAGEILSEKYSNIAHYIQDGTFEVIDLEKATAFMKLLFDLRPYLGETVPNHRYFTRALRMALNLPGVSPEEMLHKITMRGEIIERQLNVHQYLRILEQIYNHHRKDGKYARFFI